MPDVSRLLLLTHRWPYPPDKGDRIRAWGLLRELSRHFRIDLLSFCDAPPPPENLAPLRELVEDVRAIPLGAQARISAFFRSLLTQKSVTETVFSSKLFKTTLKTWLAERKYACALAICSSAGAAMLRDAELPLVVDFVDADSAKWAAYAGEGRWPGSWVYRREGRRVAHLEQRLVQRAALTVATSELELQLLGPQAQAHGLAVPNGVDIDYFAPAPKPSIRRHVSFIGQMDYPPNVQAAGWFANHVWPTLHRQNPRAEFRIVGRQPVPEVAKLAQTPGIIVTGAVADVRPYIHDSVVAVPLQIARGIQNKVLEALACGAPVVSSPQAVQGIDLGDFQPLRLCQGPAQWVSSIDYLLRRSEQADALGRQAREFILARYTWSSAVAPLIEAIRARCPLSAGG